MGRSLTKALLTATGAVLAVIVVIGAIATIAAVVFGLVATVVSLLVAAVVLGVFLLAAIGLGTLLLGVGRDRLESSPNARSWRDRLRSVGFGDEATRSDDRPVDAPADGGRDPEARIRERYLAGDIDEAEFERQMELLFETSDLEAQLGDAVSDRGSNSHSHSRSRSRSRSSGGRRRTGWRSRTTRDRDRDRNRDRKRLWER